MTIRLLKIMIISFGLWLCNCAGPDPDTRLVRIEEMASISPEEALDSLKAIQYDKLKQADKHYYDFLSVKVSDKAYIDHSSDSLILKVIDYESRHPETGRYVEALYYGARVYSDLGDYPTALQYFQNAIDELPSDEKFLNLKGNIFSQYGRMLASLRLYRESVPYVKTSLEIGKLQKDTMNIIYDSQLLGEIYLKLDSLETAKLILTDALRLSKNKPLYHKARSKMYLGEIFKQLGEIDSAVYYIRNTPELVNPNIHITAVAYAAQIYLKAGINDTAYIYAKELIESKDERRQDIGYPILLSDRLKDYSSMDTLKQYIHDYRNILEGFFDDNSNQLSLNQRAQYNYELHKKEKEKIGQQNSFLMIILLLLVIVILLLTCGVLYYKYRNQLIIQNLKQTLDRFRNLRTQIGYSPREILIESEVQKQIPIKIIPDVLPQNNQKEYLRAKIKKEILDLYEKAKIKKETSEIILKSETYDKLKKMISDEKIINEKNNFWMEIEEIVLKSAPNFKTNLYILSSGKLTAVDYHTALLIKCGIKPSQMTILFGRSNGTIVSRRKSLGKKLFNQNMETSKIDAIIHLL